MKLIIKTPADWAIDYGIDIVDPDGWRHDGKDINVPISQGEFERRMNESTINPVAPNEVSVIFNGKSVKVSRQTVIEWLKTFTAELNSWQDGERIELVKRINGTHDPLALKEATERYVQILEEIKRQRDTITVFDNLINPK